LLKHIKTTLLHTSFWLLLPLSGLQGLRLQKRAINLPEAKGEKTGVSGHGETLNLLAIGDSIIAGVGTGSVPYSLPVQFAEALAKQGARRVHWQLAGKNGADITQLRKSLRSTTELKKPDLVLISIGVNDVTGRSSTRHWQTQLRALLSDLRNRWPQATILFTGIPPMAKFPLPPQPLKFSLGLRAATLDTIAAQLVAEQSNMLHVPVEIDPLQHQFCEDGYHPSADTCHLWAEELAAQLFSDNRSNLV